MFLKASAAMESAVCFGTNEGCKVSCVKIFLSLIYQEVSIYLRCYKSSSPLRVKGNVEMW